MRGASETPVNERLQPGERGWTPFSTRETLCGVARGGRIEFRILGPLEVVRDGGALQLGGTRQRALLALLLLYANEVVSSDALVDRIWGERAPATAGKALQVYVSRLRKQLGRDALATRPPGYAIQVEPGELDLHVFEQLVSEAGSAEPEHASELLREALALWRGPALADLAYEPFAQTEIARLEELRLTAFEERAEAELALGRHSALAADLEALVARHPLRERLRGQLMLALYRSGRQAEALETYREARRLLDEELGLEPSAALKALERSILEHDPALASAPSSPESAVENDRAILVVPRADEELDALLSLAEPLGLLHPPRELVLARVVEADELGAVTVALRERRAELAQRGVVARAAAFSSPAPGEDLARLASQHDADLLLMAVGHDPIGDAGDVLDRASCDVALFLAHAGPVRPGPVVVPFGAADHDWAALELGTWVARSTGAALRLVGAASDDRDGRDASRLLADASLIVQRVADVVAEPLLATPGREGVQTLAEGAGLLVVGLSERWRREGLGGTRSAIAESPPAPTVFVRRGLRPGGLAPAETRTRFTWSLTSAAPRR
jgi:DNA-binding SARP family transcriptional activator